MKQMTKQSAIIGVTTLSSLMAVGTAAADTQDLALHQKGDDVKMEEWRTEVARIEAENAQAETDAKASLVTSTTSAHTKPTTDTSGKRLAMEERNRKLRHEYHEKYRDYLDAVNEGRKDVVEPTKPVYETMLPDNATESTPCESFTIVRWDEKPIPNVPQLEFYREANETKAPAIVESPEAPKAKEGLAPAPTPEAALTLSNAKEARSEETLVTVEEQKSKETVGEASTPENAEGADKNLAEAKEQKSKESVGEAPTPEKADGADKHLTDAKEQKSKETQAPTKTSSGDSVDTSKMDKDKVVTVKWIDGSGKELRNAQSVSPSNVPSHGNIEGYTYVTARQDDKAGEITYIFAKKTGDEVKASASETKDETPKSIEKKSAQQARAQQAPAQQAPAQQAPAQQAPAQQAPAQQAQTSKSASSELPTTGDAGSVLTALSVFPMALAGLSLRKKQNDEQFATLTHNELER